MQEKKINMLVRNKEYDRMDLKTDCELIAKNKAFLYLELIIVTKLRQNC